MSMVSPALLVAPAAEGWLRSSREPAGVLLAGAPGLRLPWRDRYPSMAMAGGMQPEHLDAALASVSKGEGKIMSMESPVLAGRARANSVASVARWFNFIART